MFGLNALVQNICEAEVIVLDNMYHMTSILQQIRLTCYITTCERTALLKNNFHCYINRICKVVCAYHSFSLLIGIRTGKLETKIKMTNIADKKTPHIFLSTGLGLKKYISCLLSGN